MKKLTFTSAMVIAAIITAIAQPPQAFKYQAVARDNSGEILQNQAVGIRISIHEGSAIGEVSYQETFTETTNQFGLLNLDIGTGVPTFGTFGTIDWSTDSKFLETEIDPAGGTAYVSIGTSELLAVPYALYSGSTIDTSKWRPNGDMLYYNNGNVGIGTSDPQGELHVLNPTGWSGITFTGTGLNDLIVDYSNYNGTGITYFIAEVTAEWMPNLFRWSNNNGASWTINVMMETSGIDVGYGVTIGFGETFGHTVGDIWSWTVSDGSTDGLIVKNSNVGIGTINPLSILHVAGDMRLDESSPYLYFYNGDSQLAFIGLWTPTSDLNIINKTSSGSLKFGTDSYERMRIDSNGKVGIGTSTPYYKLHIKEAGNGQVLRCENDVASGRLAYQYTGVYGDCVTENGGTGVSGSGGQYGVLGTNFLVTSNDKFGVKGHSADGTGANYGVYGYAGGSGINYGVYGTVYSGYGVYYSGGLGGSGSKSAIVKTDEGPKAVYCQESPENWFEDFGSAAISNGIARISIATDFLQTVTIDSEHPFKVFITPNANIGNWWVEKVNTEFILHAPDAINGAEFDYRIVAKRKGFENLRLETFVGAYTDMYLYPTIDEVPDEYKEAWLSKNQNNESEINETIK